MRAFYRKTTYTFQVITFFASRSFGISTYTCKTGFKEAKGYVHVP